MYKFLQLLFLLFAFGTGFTQPPQIKVSYFMSDGMMKAYVGGLITTTGGACAEPNGKECRVILIFRSSTGPIFSGNNCQSLTGGNGSYGSGGWSCDFRCEVEGGGCGVWFPNASATSNYPSNPGYIDTSAFPCPDIVSIRMKGWEADGAGYSASNILCFLGGICSSNLLSYNLNDGACGGLCNTSVCNGIMQVPTSGDNDVPVTVGQPGDTLRPYLGGIWSKNYISNLETPVCTSDGYNNYYYARWKYRWVWDTSTVNSTHAGNIKIPSSSQCSNVNFSILDSVQAFEANRGFTLYQWQESNNGTVWTNISGQTSKDLNATTPNVSSPTIKYYRRAARFNGNFTTPATFKDVPSNIVMITVYPSPSLTAPTLSTSTPPTTSGTPTPASICRGTLVSATFTPGTGAAVGVDEFRYSIDSGITWNNYLSGTNINTTTANGRVIIQGRRTSSSCGSTSTAWSQLAVWIISSVNIAPTMATSSVSVSTPICNTLASISGTLNPGAGGTGYQYGYSITNGSSPATTITGTGTFSIPTSGAVTRVKLFARRTGASPCFPVSWTVIASWNVIPQPINPTLNTKIPNTATICESQSVSATFNAGSQGAPNSADQYRISINNGSTWNTYIPGTNISALGGITRVIIQGIRTTGTSSGCTSNWGNLATWNITKLPTGTPVYTNLSACAGGTTATARLTVNNLLPFTTTSSWTRIVGTTATPTTATLPTFTITNLSTASRYRVTLTNGLCSRIDSVDVPLIPFIPTTSTIAPNDYCGNCTFVNNVTRYFYDAAGRISAMVYDSTTTPTLGLTEICVDVDPVQRYITDDLGYQQPYLRRRWTIKPASNAGVTVTLFFTAAELNDLKAAAGTIGLNPYAFTTPMGNLLVTKYPNGGNGIFTAPLSSGAELIMPTISAYNGTHWKAVFKVNTFSTFYIHPRREFLSALPVELVSFNAFLNDTFKNVTINWITASENNSKQFIVEKSSDAANWNTIGVVDAAGNSNSLRSYLYIDNNLALGIFYYRLKIVDIDNSYEYSRVVSIYNNISANKNILLYPNPTNDIINLVFNSDASNYSSIQIKNVIGQTVKSIIINNNNKMNNIEIDCTDLARGSYYVNIYDVNGLNNTIKFVKY